MGEVENLIEKRDALLRKKNARESLSRLASARKIRKKLLKAQIKALENPRSIAVRRRLKKIAFRGGKVLIRGAIAVNRHLDKIAAEQNKPVKRKGKQKPQKRKVKRRKKR